VNEMEIVPKEKGKKKESYPNHREKPPIAQPIPLETIVSSMKPEEEQTLLKELLGNFSDQTGACFG
jgi:hypothetical protein